MEQNKGFRVVGGQSAGGGEEPPTSDTRTEEEKLRDFFDSIIRLGPRCVTVLIEVMNEKGLAYHEMRTFPDIDVAEVGNVYLAHRALQAIIGSAITSP